MSAVLDVQISVTVYGVLPSTGKPSMAVVAGPLRAGLGSTSTAISIATFYSRALAIVPTKKTVVRILSW